jgi:hypothetical protein
MNPPRSVQRSLGSIVLGFELVMVFLGALVIFGLRALPEGMPPYYALIGGGAVLVLTVIAIGLLRFRLGIVLGWLIQAIVIASGFIVGMMFIVGLIFTAIWTYCMIVGARLDRRSAALATDQPSSNETENHS